MKFEHSSSTVSKRSVAVNTAFTNKLQEVREKVNELSSMQLLQSVENLESKTEHFRLENECCRVEKALLAFELERLREVVDNKGLTVRPRSTSADNLHVAQKAKAQKLKSELQKCRKELQQVLDERSTTVSSLSESNQRLQLQVEHLISELNEMTRQYKETSDKISSMTLYIKNIHLKEKDLKETIETLKAEHKKVLEFQQLEYAAKLATLTEKHREEMRSSELQLGQQIVMLKEQFTKKKSTTEAFAKQCKEEFSILYEKLRKLEAKIAEFEERVTKKAEEINVLVVQNQNFLNQQAQRQIEFEDEKEQLIGQFKFEQEKRELMLMEEYHELLAAQEEQSNKVIHSLRMELAAANDERSSLQSVYNQVQIEFDELQKDYNKMQKEHNTFTMTLENSVREFEQQLSYYKSLTFNFTDLEVRFEAERSSYECKLQLQSTQILSLEKQLANFQQENRHLTEESSRLKQELLGAKQRCSITIQNDTGSSEEDYKHLQLAVKKKDLELADEFEKVSILSNKLKDAESKTEHLKHHNFDLQAEIQVKNDLIENQKKQIASLKSKLNSMHFDNQEISRQVAELEYCRTDLQAQINSLTREKNQTETDYEKLTDNLIQKDEELDAMIQRIKDIEIKYLRHVKDTEITVSSSILKERETITTNRFFGREDKIGFININ